MSQLDSWSEFDVLSLFSSTEDKGALPMLGSRAKTIEALKEKVAAFDNKPVLAGTDSDSAPPAGLLATPRGYLHEVFADTLVNTGAAFGFALAQAKSMLSEARPGLLI